MRKNIIEHAISDMPPLTAAKRLVEALKKIFPLLEEDEKTELVINLFGKTASGKIGSMVHR